MGVANELVLAFHTHAKFSNLNLVEASMQNILDILDILSKKILGHTCCTLDATAQGVWFANADHWAIFTQYHFIVTNST